MTRPEASYLELSVGNDDIIEDADEDEATRVARDLFDPNVAWFDEKTARVDFDQLVLSPEAKLIAGYLTLEANDLFAELPIEEQQRVAATLKAG